MASYESTPAQVTETINQAVANGEINQSTANAINAVVAEMGAIGVTPTIVNEVVEITPENVQATVGDANIVMMAKDGTANVTFDASSPVKVMTVGGGGGSNVTFETTDNVAIQLQGGENDSVATGDGHDSIVFAGGSATINTGGGDDVVMLQGNASGGGNANIVGGDGNMTIQLQADNVNATIDAGDGFDGLSLHQPTSAGVTFSFIGGIFRMIREAITGHDADMSRAAGDSQTIDMTNVNVVQFSEDGTDDTIKEITVLAHNEGESMVAKLYAIGLGREAIDFDNPNYAGDTNLIGLQYWLDEVNANGVDRDHIYNSILGGDEFAAKYGAMSNADFANAMFANLAKAGEVASVSTVDGMTAAEFAAQLDSGVLSKADMAIKLAQSQQAVDLLGVNGSQYVIDGFDTAGE